MRVSDLMSTDLLTVAPETPLAEALDTMRRYEIHELPVVQGDRLVGWLTWRDLQSALGRPVGLGDDDALDANVLAAEISEWMAGEVQFLTPDTRICTACREIATARVGAMPVVDAERSLVGLISVTDLLMAAAERFEDAL